jgi:hypothetical protein
MVEAEAGFLRVIEIMPMLAHVRLEPVLGCIKAIRTILQATLDSINGINDYIGFVIGCIVVYHVSK